MPHQLAIVELEVMAQTGWQVENKLGRVYGRKRIMASVLQKTQSNSLAANILEYVVMLFVVLMTGLSTLRLLGILP
jgi:hypothetical protein